MAKPPSLIRLSPHTALHLLHQNREETMSTGKPSGLKPPSKIGRPAGAPTKTSPSSAAPKPLPPEKSPNIVTSPTQDGAGDFQLGERVWVNGNKPGMVQFVGGTQFAPGQWAGIVLDEAIGKNDGSVAGVRYFQCEDGRGIFTRPSKLSRTALPEKEANGGQGSPAPDASALANAAPAAGAATTAQSMTNAASSSTGAKTPLNRTLTASESVSNLSETDSAKKARRELRLGDRVLISELSVDLENKHKELLSSQQDKSSLDCKLERSVEQVGRDLQTQREETKRREEDLQERFAQVCVSSGDSALSREQLTNEKTALEAQLEVLKQQHSRSQEELHLSQQRSASENQRIGTLCKEIEDLKLASQKSQRLEEHNVEHNHQHPNMRDRGLCLWANSSPVPRPHRETLSHQDQEKELELETLRNEIAVLRGENAMAKTLQVAVETLERDKTQLQTRVHSLEQRLLGRQASEGGDSGVPSSGDPALDQLREEKEFAEGQINFLNSVIVDLQRKNEELKVKLKKMVLAEFNGNDGTDGLEEGLSKREKKPPPRLFCDICDCFDLHDTEDCPTQAQSPDSVPHSSHHGNPSDQRPYCDICEAFGHATESCNDDQTF
ncbi:CAP-Gly domain-containing linker protein 1-like [Osmerus mordax]|uniref:CAP-Gly domain-containing linker protein 1-like n=1 Tax=Osmerus mordax TaxID=8014 RepID=UPI0035108710